MQKMLAYWNKQLIWCVFSEAIECSEKSNTRINTKHSKKIDFQKSSTTKQLNRVQDIRIKVWEYKAVEFLEI